MHNLKFFQVDVFTEERLQGNPLAVFLDADGLSDALMQQIAREMNLSETTFVQTSTRDDCAYRVRIFMPSIEIPFAGHPTVGTSFVLHHLGMVAGDAFAFDMKAGRIPVRRDAKTNRFWFTPPQSRREDALSQREDIARGVGLPAGSLSADAGHYTGSVGFVCIPLVSKEAVDSVKIDRDALRKVLGEHIGGEDLLLFHYDNGNVYSRMFARPSSGIDEDPATGGSIAPLSNCILDSGFAPRTKPLEILVEQGVKMGRRSLLHARIVPSGDAVAVEVGGNAVPVFESVLKLD